MSRACVFEGVGDGGMRHDKTREKERDYADKMRGIERDKAQQN